MWRAAGILLSALVIAGGSRAAEPSPDLEKEIAWARASWPDSLRGTHFHSPLQQLLAWLPRGGSMTVYLYTSDFACRRATLLRPRVPASGDGDGGAPARPALIAKINDRPRIEDGQRVREVTFIDADLLMSRPGGTFAMEAQRSDGAWHEVGGGNFGQGGGSEGSHERYYGALSYVDDRLARWDGEPMVIRSYCDGPVEWLACPAGGERPCERCERVGLMVTAPDALAGHSRDHGHRPITCHDACPSYPQSPAIERVSALRWRASTWRPRNARLSLVPSLYKSRDECLLDHPPGR